MLRRSADDSLPTCDAKRQLIDEMDSTPRSFEAGMKASFLTWQVRTCPLPTFLPSGPRGRRLWKRGEGEMRRSGKRFHHRHSAFGLRDNVPALVFFVTAFALCLTMSLAFAMATP
eukprot:scaffold434_cov186-Pinguiococcus_pyrenoidosus.AAC.129